MSGELEKLILGDIDVEINPSESTEERDVSTRSSTKP